MIRAATLGWLVPCALLLSALLVKLGFIAYLDDRAYQDVLKAVNYGYLVHAGAYTIGTHAINSKTFLGPMLWFSLFDRLGVHGLQAVNLVAFIGLGLVQYSLGRGRYPEPARYLALLLFAFYVGTNRSIAAGEADDNLAALLLGAGILLYLERGRIFLAALLLGVGFLFKFWIAIFALGLIAFLLLERRLRELALALLGLALPFALLNLTGGLASLHAFELSFGKQQGYSTWAEVGVKLLSTGLLPCVALSAWAWLEDRRKHATLFFLLSSAYLPYVLVQRDAHAATIVMMPCLLFSSFLVAEWLRRHVSRLVDARGSPISVPVALTYILLTSAVTYVNLYRDTKPVGLVRTEAEARRMFPYNPVPDAFPASPGAGREGGKER